MGSSAPRSIPDDELTIRVRRKPKYVLVTVAGEVDIATVAQLRERLRALAASGRPLVADLEQVSFIDASGLGALAGAARLAAEHGASLQVVCARQRIRRLFRLTGLDGSIPLARTLAEALQISSWRQSPRLHSGRRPIRTCCATPWRRSGSWPDPAGCTRVIGAPGPKLLTERRCGADGAFG